MAYLGQSRSRRMIDRLNAEGFGEMVVRGDQLPPRRLPFAADNGAYRDWKAGVPFQADAFRAFLAALAQLQQRADFIVVPDVVAGGAASLAFSLEWVDEVRAVAPAYLAVQDGMDAADVARALARFDGVFVGGTTEWKWKTAEDWIRLAHAAGLPCHIARAGSRKHVHRAQAWGADSIDSCSPLRRLQFLDFFIGAVRQRPLFTERKER